MQNESRVLAFYSICIYVRMMQCELINSAVCSGKEAVRCSKLTVAEMYLEAPKKKYEIIPTPVYLSTHKLTQTVEPAWLPTEKYFDLLHYNIAHYLNS